MSKLKATFLLFTLSLFSITIKSVENDRNSNNYSMYNTIDYIQLLPHELLVDILTHLTRKDLHAFSLVNNYCRELTSYITDYTQLLPNKLLITIFKLLSVKNLHALLKVNKRYKKLALKITKLKLRNTMNSRIKFITFKREWGNTARELI